MAYGCFRRVEFLINTRLLLTWMGVLVSLFGVLPARAEGPPFDGATTYREAVVHSTYGFHDVSYEHGSGYDPDGANEPVQGILRSSVLVSSQSSLFIPGGVSVEQIDAIRIPISPPVDGWYSVQVTALVQGEAFSAGSAFLLPGNADGSFVIRTGALILDGSVRQGWGDTETLCHTELDSPWTIVANGLLDVLLTLSGLGEVGDVIDFVELLNTLHDFTNPVCNSATGSQFILEPGGAFLEGGQTYDLQIFTRAFATSLSVATVWGGHVGASDYLIQVIDYELLPQPAPLGLPTISSLTALPNPVLQGHSITLRASEVMDPDGAQIVAVEFYRDVDADGAVNQSVDEFLGSGTQTGSDWLFAEAASWPIGIHGILARATTDANQNAWGPIASLLIVVQPGNTLPVLSNPRVDPPVGSTATPFIFRVDYVDPDGDSPMQAKVYVDGIVHNMSLESGQPDNGTYSYATTLGVGTHNYFYYFVDQNSGGVLTPTLSGPTVGFSEGQTAVQFWFGGGGSVPITDDFEVRYSVDGGNEAIIPGSSLPYPGVTELIDVPAVLHLEGWPNSDNHEFLEWLIYCDSTLIEETTAQIINVTINACDELAVISYWAYTPQYYTIGGSVSDSQGPLQGVVVTISGPGLDTEFTTGSDGGYSFTNVPGGVPYTISAEHPDYAFAPPAFNIANLTESGTPFIFLGIASDGIAPEVSFVQVPEEYVEDTAQVTFVWSGSDNKTPSNLLEYQYQLLDSEDEAWSDWSTGTSIAYDLPNGIYTFKVKAKDEAGNQSDAIDHTFAIASAPGVSQCTPVNDAIWFSSLVVTAPPDVPDPSNTVIVLPERCGLIEGDFVPVRLYPAGDENALGTINYAVEEVGLPAVFAEAEIGFVLTLPTPLSPGESAEYVIQWGNLVHMGWEEDVAVPELTHMPSCPIIQHAHSPRLDETERYSRLESKKVFRIPGCYSATRDGYLSLRSFPPGGAVGSLWGIAYHPANFFPEPDDPDPSYYGTSRVFDALGDGFVESPSELWAFWRVTEYTNNPLNNPPIFDQELRGFGFQRFSKSDLNPIGDAFTSELIEDDSFSDVARSPDGNVWILGDTVDGRLVYSKVSPTGALIASRVTLATHPPGLMEPDFDSRDMVIGRDGKIWFFYARSWRASPQNDNTRMELYVKVLHPDGTTFLAEQLIGPPAAAPSAPGSDTRSFTWELRVVDQEGKVWVGFWANTSGSLTYFYSVFNENGTTFRDDVPLEQERQFRFADSDGFIWVRDAGALLVLNSDDTPAHNPWPVSALIPGQSLGIRGAQVGLSGYRIFDRWSTRSVWVDVPQGVPVGVMEIIDVDKFGQAAHVQDLEIATTGPPFETIPDEVPPISEIDVSGVLNLGLNVLNFSQTGLLGGELLVTFPQVITHSLSVTSSPEINVPIDVSPNPDAITPFTRPYLEDSVICLAAPVLHGCHQFELWRLDGADQPADDTELCLTMDSAHSALALYSSSCDDGVGCTDDSCEDGACAHTLNDALCDDDLFCNGSESCDPTNPDSDAFGCVPGATNDCDDGDPCTADHCDPADECVHEPEDCNDGDACTDDSCDPASGCAHAPIDCDDGDACTDDTCDPANGCENDSIDCDDNDACTVDACDPADGCVNEPVDCNDGNACTDDSCDPTSGCSNDLIDCDDGDACTDDSCDPTSGCVNETIDCDDNDACTSDSCNPESGCVNEPIDCDDSNACTDDSCDPATGCVNTDNSGACNDGDACTHDDTCSGGSCSGTPIDCGDEICVEGQCVPEICENPGDMCSDGNPCTEGDQCDGNLVCVGLPIDCSGENDACNMGVCNVETGDCDKLPANEDDACDDGNACTENDACDDGACLGATVDCDDGLFCNGQETCHPLLGCQLGTPPCAADCCEENGTCGSCPCTSDEDCSALDDQCNVGVCNVGTGACEPQPANEGDDCDDGNSCTSDEACSNGTCAGAPSSDPCCGNPDPCCGNSDPCCGNSDPCCGNADLCCGVDCDDGLFCNGAETCVGGGCQPGDPPCAGACCETSDACEVCPCTSDAQCDDGDICNGLETCDPITGCQPGAPLNCDDDDRCTGDNCDSATGCVNEEIDCPEGQQCVDGECVVTDCTSNTDCEEGGQRCCDIPTGSCIQCPCEDDDDCDDEAFCVDGDCVNCLDDSQCDDNIPCTDDTCDDGVCINTPIACPDGQRCVEGRCASFWTLSVVTDPARFLPVAPIEYEDSKVAEIPVPPPPEADMEFLYWEGDVPAGHETADPLFLVMDSNKSVTAVFQAIPCGDDADCGPNEVCVEGECLPDGCCGQASPLMGAMMFFGLFFMRYHMSSRRRRSQMVRP